MKRPGRPIGRRIREVCEILERLGSGHAGDIAAHTDTARFNIKKYCERAVHRGLLTADRGQTPVVYTAVADWKARADRRGSLHRTNPPNNPNPLEAAWMRTSA